MQRWNKRGLGLALALAILPQAAEAAGEIKKVDFTPGKELSLLVVNYTGQGTFRVFQSEQNSNLVVEADNLNLPASLTRAIDTGSTDGPVMQVTPYVSGTSKKPLAKFVVQLRQKAEIKSSELPGRFVVEIRRKSLADVRTAGGATLIGNARDEVKNRASANEKSEEVAQKLVDVLNAPAAEKRYFGSRVTFEASNANVHDIFRLVGESSGLNIITDTDVNATSNFSLKDIPWDQLLDIVIQQASLKAIITGNVVRIITLAKYNADQEARLKLITLGDELEPVIMAVIPLSFAKAEEMQRMIDSLVKKDVTTSTDPNNPALIPQQPPPTNPNAPPGTTPEVPRTKLVQDFVRGKIEVDTRSNSLIVTNVKDAIERIRRLVKELDVPLPQVLIDAKVVIAQESFTRSTGINWAGKVTSMGSGRAGVGLGINGGAVTLGSSEIGSPVLPIPSPTQGIGTGFQLGTGRHGNLSAILQLSESTGVTRTVASPRVIVNNKFAARISDGQTSYISTTAGPNASGTVQPVTANLDLTVTPQVTSSGSILLSVDIKKDAFSTNAGAGASVTTNNKSLTTEVLVDNGSTLVLGGVYQYGGTKNQGGIPLLKDLPFIGQLFRTDTDNNEKSELMVFITPQIIMPSATGGAPSSM